MTLQKLIKCVAEIITPYREEFYHYVLYTSDDNGDFLRTRYCWWEKPVADRRLQGKYKKVLVVCNKEINKADLLNKEDTGLKLQFHYDYTHAVFEDAQWDIEMGYCFVYLVDIDTRELIMEHKESLF